jgi:hypothetical protein
MALDAQQVDQLQNSTPTNWATFEQQQGAGVTPDSPRFAADSKLHVRFFTKPQYNPDKSAEENRPIYEDTVFVEIMMPGEKNNIIQRPALSMRDDLRFPKHYEQFTKGQQEQMVGTPLKVLPFLSEAQCEELAWFKIRTVEQLAELNDTVNFMGAQEMKQKAKKFLTAMSSGEHLLEQNRNLQTQLDEMRAMIEQMTAPKAKGKQPVAEVDPLS